MNTVKSPHHYSLHAWCSYEDEESAAKPKDGVVYQYDCINDTYYSYISAEDLSALVEETNQNGVIDAYSLLHLCDDDRNGLKAILSTAVELSEVDLEDLSYVAMTQRFGIENRKISDMLFTYLLTNGFEVDDIIEALDNGAYPEVDDDYPHLRRYIRALQKKSKKGENP